MKSLDLTSVNPSNNHNLLNERGLQAGKFATRSVTSGFNIKRFCQQLKRQGVNCCTSLLDRFSKVVSEVRNPAYYLLKYPGVSLCMALLSTAKASSLSQPALPTNRSAIANVTNPEAVSERFMDFADTNHDRFAWSADWLVPNNPAEAHRESSLPTEDTEQCVPEETSHRHNTADHPVKGQVSDKSALPLLHELTIDSDSPPGGGATTSCPPDTVASISWNPVADQMAIGIQSGDGSDDCPYSGSIQFINVTSEAFIPREIPTVEYVNSVDFNPDGSLLAAGGEEYRKVGVYSGNAPNTRLGTGTSPYLHGMYRSDFANVAVAWNPEGTQLATGLRGGAVSIFNGSDPFNLLHTLPGSRGGLSRNGLADVFYNHDGSQLAVIKFHSFNIYDVPSFNINYTRTLQLNHNFWSGAYNHDSTRLAIGGGEGGFRHELGSGAGRVWIYNGTAPDQLLNTLTDSIAPVRSVTYKPDGTQLATGSWAPDTKVRIYDENDQLLMEDNGETRNVKSVAYNRDGSLLAAGGKDGEVRFYVTAFASKEATIASELGSNARLSCNYSGHPFEVHWKKGNTVDQATELARRDFPHAGIGPALPENDRYSISDNYTLTIRNITSGDAGRYFCGIKVFGEYYIHNPTVLALQSALPVVQEISTDQNTTLCGPHKPLSVAWTPDNSRMAVGIASGSGYGPCSQVSGSVQIFNMTGSKPLLLQTLTEPTDWVRSVAYSHDGNRLAAGGDNNLVWLYDTDQHALLHTLPDATGPVNSVAFSADDTWLAVGATDKTVRIYDVHQGTLNHTLPHAEATVSSVDWSQDGKLAAASVDNSVTLYGDRDCPLKRLSDASKPLFTVDFNHDGIRLAAGGLDGMIRMYNGSALSCPPLYTLDHATSSIFTVDFNHDGSRLAAGSADQSVRIYDVNQAMLLHTVPDADSAINSIAYSGDGNRLAVAAGGDQKVRIYSTGTESDERTDTDELYGRTSTQSYERTGTALDETTVAESGSTVIGFNNMAVVAESGSTVIGSNNMAVTGIASLSVIVAAKYS